MKRKAVLLFATLALAGACTRYEQKPLPFRMPSAYPNATEVFGAVVGANALDDRAKSKELFGFDILGAGVLPVQIVFDNQGQDTIEIVPSQTFLTDPEGNLWNILDQKIAYDRLEKKTEFGQVAPEGAKKAALGAVAGAIVGAAIGIVTGQNVGETIGKGAAAGAAGGAVIGGYQGMNDPKVAKQISDDLRNRSLENKAIPPQAISQGVLFFPGEASKARRLRLQLKSGKSGEIKLLEFAL